MKNLLDTIFLNLGDLTEEEYNELDFKDLPEVIWSEDDVQGRNVEYVRKDAFIEKACEWLSKHAKKYYFNKDGHYLGTDELIEDFKLSMEL